MKNTIKNSDAVMTVPVNQDSLESQLDYFHHLNITTWKGRLYRKFFLYPLLNFHLKGKTLDVGCGLGVFLRSRRGSIGVDINPYCVEHCLENGLEAIHSPNPVFSMPSQAFDSVVFDNVIEHLDDPSDILAEISRVIRQHGTLIIGVPTFAGFHSQADHKIFYDEQNVL